MRTSWSRSCVVVVFSFCAVFAACGGRVVVDTYPGDGGGGEGGSDGPGTSTSTGPVPCTDACEGPGKASCACTRSCGVDLRRIVCDPLEDGTIQCICSVGQEVDGQQQIVFSGVCFEKNGASCDFEVGCCAKYFSGK